MGKLECCECESNTKKVLVICGAILVAAAVAAGTIFLLKSKKADK